MYSNNEYNEYTPSTKTPQVPFVISPSCSSPTPVCPPKATTDLLSVIPHQYAFLMIVLGWCKSNCGFCIVENCPQEGMATHSSILAWRIPMDRVAWWSIVHGVAESDMTEWLCIVQHWNTFLNKCSYVIHHVHHFNVHFMLYLFFC